MDVLQKLLDAVPLSRTPGNGRHFRPIAAWWTATRSFIVRLLASRRRVVDEYERRSASLHRAVPCALPRARQRLIVPEQKFQILLKDGFRDFSAAETMVA